MVNLSKCDKCGNRNVMCFICNDNKHYREWGFSHDRMIRNIAIDEFAKELKTNSELGYIGYLDRVVDEIAEQLKEESIL